MPRSLDFEHAGRSFSAELLKVDRTKLYGEVDVETFDMDDQPCALATLARDGRTIIPYGGTASAYLNEDGLWVERDTLVPVSPDGKKLPEVPSTFDHTSLLDNEVTPETYLNHAIRLSYLLKPDEALPDELQKALNGGAIFQIPFSYRGGVSADPAFVLSGEKDTLWLMIAEPSDIDFVGFEQAAICKATANTEQTEDDDDNVFDFDML